MFELADLDTATTCGEIEATQAALRELEWRELALAARWATLHGPEDDCAGGSVRPVVTARRSSVSSPARSSAW